MSLFLKATEGCNSDAAIINRRRWLPVGHCYEHVAGINIFSLPTGYLRAVDTWSTLMISRTPPSHMLRIPRQSIPHLTLDSEVRKKFVKGIWHYEEVRRETEDWKVFRRTEIALCVQGGWVSRVKGAGNELKPLFSAVTVSDEPDISFLRAEREVVRHPIILHF